jgi:hypothetical protein
MEVVLFYVFCTATLVAANYPVLMLPGTTYLNLFSLVAIMADWVCSTI